MKIFRIRRYSGISGGLNYYHHADVISKTWQTALAAAKRNKVNNWRKIDAFDKSNKTYENYEYLYMVSEDLAEKPAKHKLFKK